MFNCSFRISMKVSYQADEVLNFLKSREQFWDQLEVGGSKIPPAVENIPRCRRKSPPRSTKVEKKKKNQLKKTALSEGVGNSPANTTYKTSPNTKNTSTNKSRSRSKELKVEKKKKEKTKKEDVKKYVPVKKPKVVIKKKDFAIAPTKAAFRWRTICETYRTII